MGKTAPHCPPPAQDPNPIDPSPSTCQMALTWHRTGWVCRVRRWVGERTKEGMRLGSPEPRSAARSKRTQPIQQGWGGREAGPRTFKGAAPPSAGFFLAGTRAVQLQAGTVRGAAPRWYGRRRRWGGDKRLELDPSSAPLGRDFSHIPQVTRPFPQPPAPARRARAKVVTQPECGLEKNWEGVRVRRSGWPLLLDPGLPACGVAA